MSDFMDSEAEESGEELQVTREQDDESGDESNDDKEHDDESGEEIEDTREKDDESGEEFEGAKEQDDESGEELEDTKEQDDDGVDEEDEATARETGEFNDLIDDNPIEEDEESDGGDDEDEGPTKKRKIESDVDDDVDDDDLDLIAENTGIKLKKKKHSRVKLLDSDDDEGEEHEPENERDQIAHDIFDKDEDDEEEQSVHLSRPTSRQSVAAEYTAIENVDEEGSDEGDEIDDFIVDDDGTPSSKKKARKKRPGMDYDDSALQEAQDIFGLEFDLSELDAEMDDDDNDEDDEDLDEEELIERLEQKKAKKKAGRKKITEVFEPAEIEKGFMTIEDNKIKVTDIPERFQLRGVPVKPAEEAELLEEAEWIYKQAFMQPPISQQSFQDPNDPRQHIGFEPKPVTAIPRIKAALSFMRKEMFEVPFIAMYRKEYVEPELKKDDLWKVYEWDEKWTQFLIRKGNMKRLFEEMQAFQYDYTRSNPDMPLDEGFRLLEQEDIDKLDNAQNFDELMDIYLHFQLYYGNDIPVMQQWKESHKKKKKKMKKKMIRVKKIKLKKPAEVETGSSANENHEDNSNKKTENETDKNKEDNTSQNGEIDGKEKTDVDKNINLLENFKESSGLDDKGTDKGDNPQETKDEINTEQVDMDVDENDGSDHVEQVENESDHIEQAENESDHVDQAENEIYHVDQAENEIEHVDQSENESYKDGDTVGKDLQDGNKIGSLIEKDDKEKDSAINDIESIDHHKENQGESTKEDSNITKQIIVEDETVDPETGEILQKKMDDHVEKLDAENISSENDIDFSKNVDTNKDKDESEESEYEDKEIEVTDSEVENEEQIEQSRKRKLPRRRDLYTICKDNDLGKMASKFGLTAEQFGENVRDNYQRNEPDQHQLAPLEAAEEFISNTFPSAEAVLSGARHMVAVEISRDPLVKQTVRQVFYERAKIHITPTTKGKKEIDDFDERSSFKYLKNKPVSDLHGEQFLNMCIAEEENLLKIKIGIDLDSNSHGYSFLDEIKQLYHRDEFSHLVQEWNKQRAEALSLALNKILYPFFAKEIKHKLLAESKEFAMQVCKMKLRNWISVAPYQPDSAYNEDGEFGVENESNYCRVLGCSFESDKNAASFFAMLDTDGQVIDFLRLKYLLFRRYSEGDRENMAAYENKMKDMERLKDFVKKHQPRVIGVAAENRDSQAVHDDISRAMNELEQEQQMARVYVELVDGEVARIFQDSPRAESEFRDYPPLLRHAVSIARRLQEPLVEFAGLTDSENELLCLRIHPLQEHLPEDVLQRKLEVEFINQVNEVGVDINRCLEYPHRQVLTHYLCGLGPRKAALLLRTLRSQGSRLENRSQLVTVCEMGLQVFLNCAGFIRIEPSEINNDKYEVLDGTRIHPETYDWPRKMAIDALEYDDGMDDANPSSAVEEILEQPDRLKDLDLDAFAEELARQGYGNRQITLYDIRDELINRFKDHRTLFTGLSHEERFRLLTGETPQTLYYGKMVTSGVIGFAYKKPTREELDSANPTRNDDTNLWKCPFCLEDSFPDLSEVWTHFDNGSCPGKAVGVRCRLSNGINGFIATRNISDKKVNRPEERVKHGLTLYARVIKINYDRLQVELTCKSSDLADKQRKFCPSKDLYFDQDAYDKELKQAEAIRAVEAKRTTYLKRVISHPSFKNVTFKDAEKLLENMDQGDCIVRPSSKGTEHLTVTWKVTKNIYQHIDIREDHKENDFSIGKSLWIENEEYEDLDEIITRHITPLAAHARELCAHKYFKESDGTRQKLEEILIQEKRKTPGRIPYFFATSKQYAGKFMIGYMPRNKPRVEFVTVTIDGFRYRGRIHASTNNLLRWFKEHFRDPVPGVGTPGSVRRTPYGQTPMSMMGSVAGTPYTPGSTPSDLISTDEAAKLMQQAFPPGFGQIYNNGFAMTPGTTPSRSTPGYSTPGFSTPGGFTPQMDQSSLADNTSEPLDIEFEQTETKFTPTGKNFTPTGKVFTPGDSNYNTPVENNFTPVDNNFTPVLNNFTPMQNNFTPIQNMFTPVENYTPNENFTPVDNTFTPVDSNYTPVDSNYTPVDGNYTPVENSFTPVDTSFTPDNTFTPVENFACIDNSFQPNNFMPMGNNFNPWMQQMPPFPPGNFQVGGDETDNSYQNRNKNRQQKGGQKRKKR